MHRHYPHALGQIRVHRLGPRHSTARERHGYPELFLHHDSVPVYMTSDADIAAHSAQVASPPVVVVPGGTAAMFVDIKPGASTAMHRTVSLDYGTVIEGEVELELDDGEVRRVRKGDLVV